MKSNQIKAMTYQWGLVIRELARHECEICGMRGNNPHHIIGKRNMAVRFDFDNGVNLCPSHHTLSGSFSAHQTPVDFQEWLVEKRGEKWWNDLRIRSRLPRQKIEYEALRIYLKEALKQAEEGATRETLFKESK
jgi:hypothetical protein